MKRSVFALLATVLLAACGNGNGYVIEGRYDAAPDGTVMYMSRYLVDDIEDVLEPVDSAIVKNGRFVFEGPSEDMEVCFISSSRVVDGGFVVVEPGNIGLDMSERTRRGGTENNDVLERFLNEKEKLIAIRSMSNPDILDAIAHDEEVRDSVYLMVKLSGVVFDMYVSKVINENIGNALGHFCLTQSVGLASPEVLYPLFQLLPESFHDKLYEGKLSQLSSGVDTGKAARMYMANADNAARETAVGREAVNFELDDIHGGKVLFSDIVKKNRYTILLFWASWSDGAMSAIRELENVCGGYKGLGIVAVSLDSSIDECRNAADSSGLQAVYLCNPSGGSPEVASAYGVTGLPAMLVVNSKGTIISRTEYVQDIDKKLKEVF